MVDNELQLRIFRNENYYNGKGDAYLIYCNGGRLFLNTTKNTRKILVKPDSSMDANMVMLYAVSKGFVHILDAVYDELRYKLTTTSTSVKYDKDVLKQRLGDMKSQVLQLMMNDNDKDVNAFYSRINLLLRDM